MANSSSLAIRKKLLLGNSSILYFFKYKILWVYWRFAKVYLRKFFNFPESFPFKGVIMKMFINNCIDLIWSLIIHLLLFDKIWGFWHSHSGNFCHCIELKHRITVDSNSIKKRKNVWLGAIEFTEYNLALFEIHAFSGNNYTSSFFKRGKEKMLEDYWKIFRIFDLLRNVMYQPRVTWRPLWPAGKICLFCVWWKY